MGSTVVLADYLARQMLKDIFKDKDIDTLDEYEKSIEIYKYLINNIALDHDYYDLANKEHRKDNLDMREKVYDVFRQHTGTGYSIPQAYKLLLDQLNIISLPIFVKDNDDNPKIIMVKRGDNWSFDNVTRSILFPNEGLDNFDYDYNRLPLILQELLWVTGEKTYDEALGRPKKRENDYGLKRIAPSIDSYLIPENIKSYKKSFDIESHLIDKQR